MVFLLYSVLLSLLIGVRKFQSQSKQSSFLHQKWYFSGIQMPDYTWIELWGQPLESVHGARSKNFCTTCDWRWNNFHNRLFNSHPFLTLILLLYPISFFCPTRTGWPRQSQLSANNSPFVAGSNQISQDGVGWSVYYESILTKETLLCLLLRELDWDLGIANDFD